MRAEDRLGRAGEEMAVAYLRRLGMTVLDRNWRCDDGELDIVALDHDTLVICEVKTRSGLGYGSPLEAVGPDKLTRLYRLAGRWCRSHPVPRGTPYRRIRVDVVGIVDDGSGPPSIDHVSEVS